jgi:hypothetical protein
MAEHPDVAHETHDVSVRAILGFGIGLLVAAVVIHVGIWLLFRFLQGRAERRDVPPTTLAARRPVEAQRQPEKIFPEPRLERFPFVTRDRLRKEEETRLHGYAWVDRDGGVARIPIERAMELIAERGLPPVTGVPPAPAVTPVAPPASPARRTS